MSFVIGTLAMNLGQVRKRHFPPLQLLKLFFFFLKKKPLNYFSEAAVSKLNAGQH